MPNMKHARMTPPLLSASMGTLHTSEKSRVVQRRHQPRLPSIGRFPARCFIRPLVRALAMTVQPVSYPPVADIVPLGFCPAGFLTLYLYLSHGSPRPAVTTLSMALGIIIPADVLRLNHRGFERIYEKVLGFLMRESEKVSLSRSLSPHNTNVRRRKRPTASFGISSASSGCWHCTLSMSPSYPSLCAFMFQ